MTLNLSHKFLVVNVGIILVLTGISLALSFASSKTLLSKAMNGVDVKAMGLLSIRLQNLYQGHKTWNGLIEDKKLWADTVNAAFFEVFLSIQLPAPPIKTQAYDIKNNNGHAKKETPVCELSFGSFLQRLALLDESKNVIIESEILVHDVNFQKIVFQGKIIGWLRVGKINVDTLPLGAQIFEEQLRLTTWTIIFGAIIAILLSYIFSRHITAPIKKLTRAAREISKRNFNTKLEVNTKDELEELALSFNSISSELSIYDTRQKQWLMDVSHELRTPLTILIGEISAIFDNINTCDADAVASLQEEVMHIKRLVDDLNEIAIIERTNFSSNRQMLNLNKLLNHYSQRYKNKLLEKGIQLHNDLIDPSIHILGDDVRMAQVFVNVYENSLRYTRSPGDLWVSAKLQGTQVCITFEDSGPGVPKESLDKIFDRLYRVETSRNRVTGGLGLGLSICRQIVHAHNGVITASNGAKGGLCIQILLPLAGR